MGDSLYLLAFYHKPLILMVIVPVKDRIFVRPDMPKEKLVNQIIQIEQVQPPPNTGTVMAAGPECEGIEPGARVVFQRMHMFPVYDIEGGEYHVIHMRDIYAVIEESVADAPVLLNESAEKALEVLSS